MDPTSAQRLAERIYAQELREANTTDVVDVVKRTHQKLAAAIAPVVGEAGFAAMMARTVQMVRAEYPRLDRAAAVSVDISPGALAAALEGHKPQVVQAVAIALLRRFLMLLATFIGTELGLRLLFSTWPDAIACAIGSAERS
jgi:hypothetical protein